MFRQVLAAQEDGLSREELPGQVLHPPVRQQGAKLSLVRAPSDPTLLVGIQKLLSGRQSRFVHILGAADLPEEVAEVVTLCEPGELRGVVEPHVDKAIDPGSP